MAHIIYLEVNSLLQLYTVNDEGVAVNDGDYITFTNKAHGCCNISVPTNTINISKAGNYKVSFNCVVSANSTSSGVINVSLINSGVESIFDFSSAQSASDSDIENMSFTALISVKPSCVYVNNAASLQFKVSGVDTLVYLANVVVERM